MLRNSSPSYAFPIPDAEAGASFFSADFSAAATAAAPTASAPRAMDRLRRVFKVPSLGRHESAADSTEHAPPSSGALLWSRREESPLRFELSRRRSRSDRLRRQSSLPRERSAGAGSGSRSSARPREPRPG